MATSSAVGCTARSKIPPASNAMRPASVETMALVADQQTLPAQLVNDPSLSIATLGSATLVGGENGLFRLTFTGLEQVDPSPVHGLATLAGSREIVIASDQGLLLWNGTLQPSPLNDHLGGAKPTALATRGTELWIGTDQELFMLASSSLSSFADITNTKSISTFKGSDELLIESASGKFSRLRVEDGTYLFGSLDGEVAASALMPGHDGRIFALVNGALETRVLDGTGKNASWLPFALTPDRYDRGATGIQAITIDPANGTLWIIQASALLKLDQDTLSTAAGPHTMGPAQVVSITADGALWISDGTSLRRFRPVPKTPAPGSTPDPTMMMPDPMDPGMTEPVTYANNIAKFSRDNCERCHAPLKIAHPLITYEDWTFDIDMIIYDLDHGRMPQDGAPLVGGSVDLIRAWKRQGLPR